MARAGVMVKQKQKEITPEVRGLWLSETGMLSAGLRGPREVEVDQEVYNLLSLVLPEKRGELHAQILRDRAEAAAKTETPVSAEAPTSAEVTTPSPTA
jgi:hypothetical protein